MDFCSAGKTSFPFPADNLPGIFSGENKITREAKNVLFPR